MSLSNNEPTLTAFVSKESDEKNTYKSGDKVKCNYGEGTVTGELRNGWSIYIDGSKYADLYKDRLQSKNITITPYEPTQTSNSMEPTLTAFVSRGSDEQKTYKSGDTVKINYGYGPEVIGELRNGWSIYSNGSNIADLDNKAVISLDTIKNTRSYLKAYDRQISKGAIADSPEEGAVKKVLGALDQQLKKDLQDDPWLIEYNNISNRYKSYKDRFSGAVGDMLKMENGRLKLADEDVFGVSFKS